MVNCADEAVWSRLLADEVSDADREELEDHLDCCESCRDRLLVLADGSGSASASGSESDERWPDVPGYRLVAEIGRGGMGVVYRARSKGFDRPVAVKVLSGRIGPTAEVRAAREATALSRLDHPNIIKILEVGEADGRPFLVMEWIEGGDLAKRLRSGPLTPSDAARVARALAHAVAAAHSEGIVHRDIKPSNVLIDRDGFPRLTDFGLAREVESAALLTSAGTALGTPAYMPPEQVDPGLGEIGPAADVYSLGATLYHMITGLTPFRGGTTMGVLRQVVAREPVAPRVIDPSIPADLESVCLKCLEKRPGRRYPSASAMADDLGRFLAGRRVSVGARRPVLRALRGARRRPWHVASLAMVAAMAGALVGAAEAHRRQAETSRAESRQLLDSAAELVDATLAEGYMAIWKNQAGANDFAAMLFRESESFLAKYVAGHPPGAPWSSPEVRALYDLALCRMRRNYSDEAQVILQRCSELGHPLLDARSDDIRLVIVLAQVENQLLIFADRSGRGPAVTAHSEAAYRVVKRIGIGDLDRPGAYYIKSITALNFGGHLWQSGRRDEALRVETEALAFDREALATRPNDIHIKNRMTYQLTRLARYRLEMGKIEGTTALIDEAAAHLARIPDAGAWAIDYPLSTLRTGLDEVRALLATKGKGR